MRRDLLRWLGKVTPRRIAEILEILDDGHWHAISDVQRRMKLSEDQIKRVADFLAEYDFVNVDSGKNMVRIKDSVRKFLFQKATS